MGGLLQSLGDSLSGLFAGTIGAAAEAIRGAVYQLQASVPPLVLIVGVFVVLAGAAWLLARR
jgi:hypothetical protein